MPPNGFNCQFENIDLTKLMELSVDGIVKLDSVDKIRYGLADSLRFNEIVNVDIVLSGYQLPDGIEHRDDIQLLSYGSRFASVNTGISGVKWLAMQDEIEWLEEKPEAFALILLPTL